MDYVYFLISRHSLVVINYCRYTTVIADYYITASFV